MASIGSGAIRNRGFVGGSCVVYLKTGKELHHTTGLTWEMYWMRREKRAGKGEQRGVPGDTSNRRERER